MNVEKLDSGITLFTWTLMDMEMKTSIYIGMNSGITFRKMNVKKFTPSFYLNCYEGLESINQDSSIRGVLNTQTYNLTHPAELILDNRC